MKNEKYNHAEAYYLMIYVCPTCKTIELIWNSRDGVTPFSINCLTCGNNTHSNFRYNKIQSETLYPPNVRWFIDKTLDSHIKYVDSYIEKVKNEDLFKNMFPTKDDINTFRKEQIESFKKGSPDILSIDKVNEKLKDLPSLLQEKFNNLKQDNNEKK